MPDPTFRPVAEAHYTLGGWLGGYLRRVTDQWIKPAPHANPAMLEIFRDRDRLPRRCMVPWAGEFAGKYLTHAVQVFRLTRDADLEAHLRWFVGALVACQDTGGYLGPWPRKHRLTGWAPNVGRSAEQWTWQPWGHYQFETDEKDGGSTWDAWGHYHVMLGLLLWHETSGDRKALRAARRIGDLLCKTFLGKRKRRLVDTGSTEMNLAPVHSLALLYERTRHRPYLDLALQTVDEFAAAGPDGPLAGDYLRTALAGTPFHQTPKPRWESLHPIMGLAELYRITGRDHLRRAFEHIWWSIVETDRHTGGGFTTGERACGNPYAHGAIETCCTIAWIAMSVEMLKLTGDSVVADEIELSTLNSVVGMHSWSGRWVTYNTPTDGIRVASAHHIAFQAREGTPELNCCSVNGPRGFGLLSDWAVMQSGDGLVVNYYGPSTVTVPLPKGPCVTLVQETDYPRRGRIDLRVSPARPAAFALRVRVPYWSARSAVRVNGRRVGGVEPGQYVVIDRRWRRGDVVRIDLDMSLHYWVGQQECTGKVSVYRGPLCLVYDRRHNDVDPADVPAIDVRRMRARLLRTRLEPEPILLVEVPAARGRTLRLCDFGSAGEAGSPYWSWLKATNAPTPAPFSRSNPLRSVRV